MLFDDTYFTVDKSAEGLFTDRGSKFLAFAYPINSEADIKPILAKLKAAHPKANHHCWAMRMGTDRSVFRINDDGEPSGTGGRPILNILLSRNITNVIVIVVRYFGGTLLGVPGLINAYRTAAEEALKSANVIEKTVNDVYTIQFDYLLMNEVMRVIKADNLTILNQKFDNDSSIQLSIRKMQVNQVLGKLQNIAGIKVKFDHSV
jgi:uncharacterized YigZ family protein